MMRRDPLANPEELIRRLYSYVAYAIGDGPDAEDVTSEAFERAIRYRKTYDPAKGSPATWLVGIARRCIADRARPTAGADPLEHDRGEDVHEGRIETLAVRAAVARLPERDRELVALRYGADLTARQIAELLDLQTNAVEVALHRLHRKLRDELADDFGPNPRKGLGPATGI
ncbi:MAG TPA: sigma-70 family RNA polymerase sigma factor [Gaiellaceae bacterium]|nr:sigma-70 family RNA polymerase sigma factor [Gaiellaceae bacterium]